MHASRSQRQEQILGPITLTQFFQKYWEKQPLHISRSEREHFQGLLSLAEIEALFSSHELRFPAVQLTQAGREIAPQEYTDHEDKILPLRLMQRHRAGATVVISGAARVFHNLATGTREFGAALGMRSQANVYLSPPGRQGFNPHFDTHDVFILQVNGCKRFRMYEGGVELPFNQQKFDPSVFSAGEYNAEIKLEAGDTLYIPRGVMHDAIADDLQPSLHITLGAMPIVMRDLMQEMLQIAAEKDVRFRQSVDLSLISQKGNVDKADLAPQHDLLQQLLGSVFSTDNLDEAISSLRDDLFLDRQPDCTGLLCMSAGSSELGLSSKVEIAPELDIELERCGNNVKLRASGRVLEFSDPMAAALEWLLNERTAVVDEFPGLNAQQRVALAQSLRAEMILKIIPTY